MSEFWDAYDAEMNLLEGVVLVRDEPVPAGMYHLICEVLVRHTDGTYLIMQRDARKNYGGYWEATAGGSALRGETPEQIGVRILRSIKRFKKTRGNVHDDPLVERIIMNNGPVDLPRGNGNDVPWLQVIAAPLDFIADVA